MTRCNIGIDKLFKKKIQQLKENLVDQVQRVVR